MLNTSCEVIGSRSDACHWKQMQNVALFVGHPAVSSVVHCVDQGETSLYTVAAAYIVHKQKANMTDGACDTVVPVDK